MRKQQPRAGQNWILDNFLKLSDNEDVLHPGILGLRLDRGFVYADLEEVFHSAKSRRALPKAWERVARRRETQAEEALAAGYKVTAARNFHRALLYFGRAQHLIPVDGHPRKIEYFAGMARCREQLHALVDGVSKHDLEFEPGKLTHAVFHKAPGEGRKPTVLYIPGMDATKDDNPSPFNNEFARRGMNICSMDGPGQGECNLNRVWLTPDNYARAAKRVIDWLLTRDDVDPDRIAVYGGSMGTRWGVELAAIDHHVKALVGQMPCVGPMDIIFEQAQPNFKRIYMYMCNMSDEDEFDRMVRGFDLTRPGRQMTCPYLLVGGELDELCTPEDMKAFFDVLTCPKEMWLYEGVFHPMGEVAADITGAIADWILDTLSDGLPAGHERVVVVPEQ
jgi:pimeloyl-ACP methyl ester carboxylesterase